MEPGSQIIFGPFRLDATSQRLWKGEQAVQLEPQPLAVLHYLAEHAGQLVTKDDLLKTLWTGTYVTKAVIKTCLHEIRRALGEDTAAPCYIATVGREGYRFIAPVAAGADSVPSSDTQDSALGFGGTVLVGREAELARFHALLQRALNGERQLVFVTGEPGIGKTTVIDLFRAQLRTSENITVGYGQCIEQYGGGEAYLPILEAMGRLCREADGQNLRGTLRQYAPTWLVQLSGVINETEAQTLRLHVQGATQQRMLREIAEALEQFTQHQPLVLVLEDLHWSDQATVELLSYLAQRRERARLLVLGTYRPADLVLDSHPLKAVKQELQAKRQCEELRLELLSPHEIRDYLSKRFLHNHFPSDLAEEIQRRTEGNALFMVNMVEELLQQGRIVEEHEGWLLKGDVTQVSVPDTLRELIEKQALQRSKQEQQVLEVASVAGTEFDVAAVAAALRQDIDEVEEVCEELAWQGHFLEERGIAEWPDGIVSGRYAFRHALYQNVLYGKIAEARRVRLHRSIGERLEAAYGEQVKEIAAELALHFEQGHIYIQAISYRQLASHTALRRFAYQEAINHLTRGLEMLKTLPNTAERIQQEISLQLALGPVLVVTKSMGAAAVQTSYSRARELCQQIGEIPQLVPALLGLLRFYAHRAETQKVRELEELLLRVAQSVHDPSLRLQIYSAQGATLFWRGELVAAREYLTKSMALYNPQQHQALVLQYDADPRVTCGTYAAFTLWHLGYPDQALRESQRGLSLAREAAHPFSVAYALSASAWLYQLRREAQRTQVQAEATVCLAMEREFPSWISLGKMLLGWALAQQGRGKEGIVQLDQGLSFHRDKGSELGLTKYLTLLAEAYEKEGEPNNELRVLTEALNVVDTRGERAYEAELHRLKGELTLQQENQKTKSKRQKARGTEPRSLTPDAQGEAEACFLQAIDITQKQQAKSLELRATMSLARLWSQQGKRHEARDRLAAVYNWFTEGFDTKDLQEAKALLEELR